MMIRRAENKDIPKLTELLLQVHLIHSDGRPDIFRRGAKKYTEDELAEIIGDEERPIYVADIDGTVSGYAFCILKVTEGDKSLLDRRELYIDDLCVDEKMRGMHMGEALYRFVTEEAKRLGCYHVTLNVWSLNPGAMRFYEKMGMVPMKVMMENILT